MVAYTTAPIVEIDTEATAAYIRFSKGKVAKTSPYGDGENLVMVDYDLKGRILGIEVVGTQEFSIGKLLKKTPVRLPKETMNRARYVTAALQTA